jgi:hypothetical protein
MRNTIHLVTTEDAVRMKPLFMPLGERGFLRGSPWGKNLRGADMNAIANAGREIMGERPRTVAALAKLLGARFPDHDSLSMAYGVRYMAALVFTPPRGVWGGTGPVALTTFEAWLGRPPGPAMSREDLVLRYLEAFGPASPADFRAWSGLAMREIFETLRPRLVTFRDAKGVELFDVSSAPRPDPDIVVPVRFLPDFDNILLAHADRTRIMAPGQHLGLFSSNGIMKGSILVDGFIRAAWIPVRTSGATTMAVTPFEKPMTKAEQARVADEGSELLKLLAPGEKHDISFRPAKS